VVDVDVRFECTQCGNCCRHLKLPLTAAEAVDWLTNGHQVQLICDASPWPEESPARDQKAAHWGRRSFAAMSGSVPTRVVVILAANLAGACPNLLADMRCGIYERRPLVCRIYPAEINPFVRLEPDKKACPPEAWAAHHPLLQRDGRLMSDVVRRDVRRSRDTDADDTDTKLRVCAALNLIDVALAEEGFVVYSPAVATLLSALSRAVRNSDGAPPLRRWRFVSNRSETIADLSRSGAVAIHSRSMEAGPEYLGFRSESPVPSDVTLG
jgi:Fe-S-cluster containining protein